MKNHALDTLLRSAARARFPESPAEPPFGFATRVAALWHSAPGRDRFAAEALWFRRAFYCASAVAVLTVGWSFQADTAPASDDLAIASYDTSVDLP